MAHILVVDDEQSICELLEITFRKEGHRVEVARNGETAKRLLKSQIFDIVISDIRMPDTTGVELLQFCKELSPSSYFLLITGVPTIETAIAAINSSKTTIWSTSCAVPCVKWMRRFASSTKPVICAASCAGSRARTTSSGTAPR